MFEGDRREPGIHGVSRLPLSAAFDCRVPVGLQAVAGRSPRQEYPPPNLRASQGISILTIRKVVVSERDHQLVRRLGSSWRRFSGKSSVCGYKRLAIIFAPKSYRRSRSLRRRTVCGYKRLAIAFARSFIGRSRSLRRASRYAKDLPSPNRGAKHLHEALPIAS
jgi:hypothetical protein